MARLAVVDERLYNKLGFLSKSSVILVLCVMRHRNKRSKVAWMKTSTIKKDTGFCKRTIQRARQEIQDAGILWERRNNNSFCFGFCHNFAVEQDFHRSYMMTAKGVTKESPLGCQGSPFRGGETVTPNNTTKYTTKKQQSKNSPEPPPPSAVRAGEVSQKREKKTEEEKKARWKQSILDLNKRLAASRGDVSPQVNTEAT